MNVGAVYEERKLRSSFPPAFSVLSLSWSCTICYEIYIWKIGVYDENVEIIITSGS